MKQPLVALRRVPAVLGGEHHLVAAIAQEPPRDRDLGRVEVAIGQGHEHAHGQIVVAQ